jgi:hypothetical protein
MLLYQQRAFVFQLEMVNLSLSSNQASTHDITAGRLEMFSVLPSCDDS